MHRNFHNNVKFGLNIHDPAQGQRIRTVAGQGKSGTEMQKTGQKNG
jgi:hypothetical protein